MSMMTKRERYIAEALSKPVQIVGLKETETMKRIKLHKVESEIYSNLHDQYITPYEELSEDTLPPFLRNMNKLRVLRIEKQLKDIVQAYAVPLQLNSEPQPEKASRSGNRSATSIFDDEDAVQPSEKSRFDARAALSRNH